MVGLAIIGAGAAGIGPLVWAAQNNKLHAWLDVGMAIVEQRAAAGGDIGKYVVDADSQGTSFLECLDAPAAQDLLAPLRAEAAIQDLERYRRAYPPLSLVGQYMDRLGATFTSFVAGHPGGSFLTNTAARSLHLGRDDTVTVRLSSGEALAARTILLALGGRQDMAAARNLELLPGVRLADLARTEIMLSDRLLTADGLAEADRILAQARRPRLIILGGSHSAFSAAWALLNKLPAARFAAGDITLLHRRPPRVFYPTREAAMEDGYAVRDSDICPVTNRVHRLGGLRNRGRDLCRQLTRRPGTVPEPRIHMLSLADPALSVAQLRGLFDEAALIVTAVGYRLRTMPVFDSDGRPMDLAADHGQRAVERDCRLRLTDGGSLPNVFAMGLGSGYLPWGRMGGEAGFDGQQNSLWLYQNDIGAVVYEEVQRWLVSSAVRRVPRAPRAPASAPAVAAPETLAQVTVPR